MTSNNLCDPCRGRGKQMNGENWCPICEEMLCSDCTSYHKTLKATKNHELVDIKLAASLPSDFSTQQFCEKHQNIPIENYCTDHDDICCRACVVETHRQCEKVVALDMACEHAKRSLLYDASKETKRIFDIVQELEKEMVANVKMIEDDSIKIKREISKAKKRIMDKINELESSLLEELHEKKDNAKGKIEKNGKKILEIKEKSESQMKQIQFVDEHGTDRQAFILAHKLKPFFRETEQSITEITTKGKKYNMSFNDHKNVISFLGTISENETPIDVRYTPIKLQQAQFKSEKSIPKKTFDINYQFDTTGINILGMTATDDNKLLLCDFKDNSGVLVYTQEGRYIQTITMADRPFDIAHIPNSDRFVVSLKTIKSIQFLHRDMKPGKTVKLDFRHETWGVAATSQNIYTADLEKILVLDTDGKIQKQIIVKYTFYIHALESGKYYVTNMCSSRCQLVGIDGKIESSTTNDFKGSTKVVVDLVGFVYVADNNGGKIHRFKADLTPDMKIENEVFKDMWAICFSKDCSKLFVANNRGKSIIVLNCK